MADARPCNGFVVLRRVRNSRTIIIIIIICYVISFSLWFAHPQRSCDSSIVTLTMYSYFFNRQTTFYLLLHTYKFMHQHIVETNVTSKTTNNTTHVNTTTSENTIKHTIMPTETTDCTL